MKPINTVCVFIFSLASCTAIRTNDEDSKMEMMTSEIKVSDPVIELIHFMYLLYFSTSNSLYFLRIFRQDWQHWKWDRGKMKRSQFQGSKRNSRLSSFVAYYFCKRHEKYIFRYLQRTEMYARTCNYCSLPTISSAFFV